MLTADAVERNPAWRTFRIPGCFPARAHSRLPTRSDFQTGSVGRGPHQHRVRRKLHENRVPAPRPQESCSRAAPCNKIRGTKPTHFPAETLNIPGGCRFGRRRGKPCLPPCAAGTSLTSQPTATTIPSGEESRESLRSTDASPFARDLVKCVAANL